MTILRMKLLTKFSNIFTEFLNQCKWKASKSFDWSFCILWCLCRQLNSRATVCLNKSHTCSFDSDCIILSKGVGVNLNEFSTDWTDLTSEFWIAYIRIGHNHTRCHRHDQKGKIHIFSFSFQCEWLNVDDMLNFSSVFISKICMFHRISISIKHEYSYNS